METPSPSREKRKSTYVRHPPLVLLRTAAAPDSGSDGQHAARLQFALFSPIPSPARGTQGARLRLLLSGLRLLLSGLVSVSSLPLGSVVSVSSLPLGSVVSRLLTSRSGLVSRLLTSRSGLVSRLQAPR